MNRRLFIAVTKPSISFISRRGVVDLTHIRKGSDGKSYFPQMVDVTSKNCTFRTATATAKVCLPLEVIEKLQLNRKESTGSFEILAKKGPVISTAIIAGVLAAKKTSELIPFCHNIPIDGVDINVELMETSTSSNGPSQHFLDISCTVKTSAKTGVEMEALVGVSNAALCVYDMLKAVSHNIVIKEIALAAKEGGKHTFKRQ